MDQQREAGTLGMWVFLITEIMFFGGLFLAYILFRSQFSHEFAVASHALDIRLGALNTGVLIGSSLTMALAVYYSQVGNRKLLVTYLALTLVLGAVFNGRRPSMLGPATRLPGKWMSEGCRCSTGSILP